MLVVNRLMFKWLIFCLTSDTCYQLSIINKWLHLKWTLSTYGCYNWLAKFRNVFLTNYFILVIVLNIHHKHTVSDRIPKWASYCIFEILPKWIFIQGPIRLSRVKKEKTSIKKKTEVKTELGRDIFLQMEPTRLLKDNFIINI